MTWWPELDQLTGQVAGVDALAAGMRVAPVGEVGDAEASHGGDVAVIVTARGYRRFRGIS